MFEDFNKNRSVVFGAYKKLKSFYYYDKSILYNKMRLAMWESDSHRMDESVNALANFLVTTEGNLNQEYLNNLLKGLDIVPVPKSFSEPPEEANLVNNVVDSHRELSKVNFFIVAPVELLILDTIWTLMISKIAFDQNAISSDCYSNEIQVHQIFNSNSSLIDGIDFESNRFFSPYYKQYKLWRDNAFISIRDRYDNNTDSILLSLDIKGYFYSVMFSFDSLPKLLNQDDRLLSLSPLTKVVQSIYLRYTAEIQKYRGTIPADCSKNQSAFPIGLQSSMVLSNLYLKEFDNIIKARIQPVYYGRYVDDILIVVEKSPEMDISIENIMQETFIHHQILKKVGPEYETVIPKGLQLQKKKIRCIYVDHTQPGAIVKLLCDAGNITPSLSNGQFMPDIDISGSSFDSYAYTLGSQNGVIKIRDFLFSPNNYTATLFLNDLIRTSKDIDVDDSNFKKFINAQLKQIFKFYSSVQSIEYRNTWINIFSLTLLNKRYDCFAEFYFQTLVAIKSIHTTSIEEIRDAKMETILGQVKAAMQEQLSLAASIAIAPTRDGETEGNIAHAMQCKSRTESFSALTREMFHNADDIRKSNLFNNHMSRFPLISYMPESIIQECSLVEISPSDLVNRISNNNDTLPLCNSKLSLAPRFIHFDELCYLSFLCHFSEGGNPLYNKLNNILLKFKEINSLNNSITEVEYIEGFPEDYTPSLTLHKINAPFRRNWQPKEDFHTETLKLALASIDITEEDIKMAIGTPRHGLSPSAKTNLYKLLNEALLNKAKLIVFPEYYLPLEWIEEIYAFSRKNSITIISGLRYMVHGKKAYNYIAVFQPFCSKRGYRYAMPLLREKNHYAPQEVEELSAMGYACMDPIKPSTHLISWRDVNYSDMLCYELTDIDYRSRLRRKIELLIVPELNRDTDYFSNIVESSVRDLHCFIAQANTSRYGDSRITGPYNTVFKDIVKVKGGENNMLLIGSINVEELKRCRLKYVDGKAGVSGNVRPSRKVKDPPAGFYVSKEAPSGDS